MISLKSVCRVMADKMERLKVTPFCMCVHVCSHMIKERKKVFVNA